MKYKIDQDSKYSNIPLSRKLIGAFGIEKHQPIVILTNEFKIGILFYINFYLKLLVRVSKLGVVNPVIQRPNL